MDCTIANCKNCNHKNFMQQAFSCILEPVSSQKFQRMWYKLALVPTNSFINSFISKGGKQGTFYYMWHQDITDSNYQSLCRAAGSNLRMVRPGSMSTVKPLTIHGHEVQAKILDLPSYLSVRRCSHSTSASNWGLPLLCFHALQGSSILIKSWENTIICNILFFVVLQQRPWLIPCTFSYRLKRP